MRMMFQIIPIMWRAVRPSKVADMPAVVNTFWLPKGYDGLTFFGKILAPTQELADSFNGAYNTLKNHEMIHLRQAQSCGDSWFRFYLLYLWYYMKGLRMRRQLKNAAYLLNPFELEAYGRMYDLSYLKGPATEWRQYAKMSMKQRLEHYQKSHTTP